MVFICLQFQNAFYERLGNLASFQLYPMLVVDMMHEFELGVWKAVLTHLLRVLQAKEAGRDLIVEFDYRLVQII